MAGGEGDPRGLGHRNSGSKGTMQNLLASFCWHIFKSINNFAFFYTQENAFKSHLVDLGRRPPQLHLSSTLTSSSSSSSNSSSSTSSCSSIYESWSIKIRSDLELAINQPSNLRVALSSSQMHLQDRKRICNAINSFATSQVPNFGIANAFAARD